MSPKKVFSKQKAPTELRVMERLTMVEQFLATLKGEFESAVFRPNKIVADGIASGLDLIDEAIEFLASEDYQEADRACRTAWLHGHLARGIFDAETTEHYLGEGVFLELDIEVDDWRSFAAQELGCLQDEIVAFRKLIGDSEKQKKRR